MANSKRTYRNTWIAVWAVLAAAVAFNLTFKFSDTVAGSALARHVRSAGMVLGVTCFYAWFIALLLMIVPALRGVLARLLMMLATLAGIALVLESILFGYLGDILFGCVFQVVLVCASGWILGARQNRERRKPAFTGRCLGCGFDLLGVTTGGCPQCGEPAPAALKRMQSARASSAAALETFDPKTEPPDDPQPTD